MSFKKAKEVGPRAWALSRSANSSAVTSAARGASWRRGSDGAIASKLLRRRSSSSFSDGQDFNEGPYVPFTTRARARHAPGRARDASGESQENAESPLLATWPEGGIREDPLPVDVAVLVERSAFLAKVGNIEASAGNIASQGAGISASLARVRYASERFLVELEVGRLKISGDDVRIDVLVPKAGAKWGRGELRVEVSPIGVSPNGFLPHIEAIASYERLDGSIIFVSPRAPWVTIVYPLALDRLPAPAESAQDTSEAGGEKDEAPLDPSAWFAALGDEELKRVKDLYRDNGFDPLAQGDLP
jgi:hypothetical protein